MLLAIDIGNTNIVIAVFYGTDLKYRKRIQTDSVFSKIYKSFQKIKTKYDIEGIIVSSVVPEIDTKITQALKKIFSITPFFITCDIYPLLINLKVKKPNQVGADRIVNAFAAKQLYKKIPIIIIDFGTATTFCVIDIQGKYIGGAISPGVVISRDALYEKTAKLPLVKLKFPKYVIGGNTTLAMQSGILNGYVGLVEYIVKKIKRELQKNPLVIATGGLAKIISSKTDIIKIVDPDLTLKGLRLIWEKIWKTNQKNQQKN